MKGMTKSVATVIGLSLLLVVSPAAAQVRSTSDASVGSDEQGEDQTELQPRHLDAPLQTNPSGRTARSSIGQVGERQTRDQASQVWGIAPMARITSRVQNRVQNRVRNRIDRYYNPRAKATDPFVIAGDQARNSGRPR